MFEDFQLENLDVGEVRVRVRYAGDGPAVLLVHGHPRTHAHLVCSGSSLGPGGFQRRLPRLAWLWGLVDPPGPP